MLEPSLHVHTVENSITCLYTWTFYFNQGQLTPMQLYAITIITLDSTATAGLDGFSMIQWSLISHSVDQPSKSLRRPLDWDRHLDGPALLAVPGLLPQGFSGFSEGAIWVRFRLVGFTLHWMSCNLKCVTWPATWLRWWYLIYTHSRHLQTCCRNLAIYG